MCLLCYRYAWRLESGSSTSIGPSADHTMSSNLGAFALVEDSTGTLYSSAVFETPALGATSVTCILSFWYHGSSDGTIRVSGIALIIFYLFILSSATLLLCFCFVRMDFVSFLWFCFVRMDFVLFVWFLFCSYGFCFVRMVFVCFYVIFVSAFLM